MQATLVKISWNTSKIFWNVYLTIMMNKAKFPEITKNKTKKQKKSWKLTFLTL